MKALLLVTFCIVAAHGGLIPLGHPLGHPLGVSLVRIGGLDNAIIDSNRIGANFAYTTLAGHSYPAAVHPYFGNLGWGYQPTILPGYSYNDLQRLYPGSIVLPGGGIIPLTPAVAVPGAEEPKKPETASEESAAKPEEASEEPKPAEPENVDESVGEAHNEGTEATNPSEENNAQSDDSVSVDSA